MSISFNLPSFRNDFSLIAQNIASIASLVKFLNRLISLISLISRSIEKMAQISKFGVQHIRVKTKPVEVFALCRVDIENLLKALIMRSNKP